MIGIKDGDVAAMVKTASLTSSSASADHQAGGAQGNLPDSPSTAEPPLTARNQRANCCWLKQLQIADSVFLAVPGAEMAVWYISAGSAVFGWIGSLITAAMGRLGEPDYRSSAKNRLGRGGMMRPPAGCPAVARAGEMMAACRRRTTSR